MKKIKAQSIIEYVAVVIIVLGALVAMRIYFQRAVNERARQTADIFGGGEQYQPGVTTQTNYH
jgi:uncharacterized membrane protein